MEPWGRRQFLVLGYSGPLLNSDHLWIIFSPQTLLRRSSVDSVRLAFSVAVLENILVVVTFVFNPLMRSTTNSFIVSLAVSDFLMAITCMPVNLGSVHTTYWVFGPFACKMVPYVMTVAVACSSLTLCCIALDRYKAIVHPLKLRLYNTPGHVGVLLCLVWFLAALSAVPNVVFYKIENVEVNYSRGDSNSSQNWDQSSYPLCAWLGTDVQELVFQWFQFGVLFIAPFSVMIIFYGIIAYRLWIRKPIGVRVLRAGNKNTRMKKKVIKMLVIVVTLFAVCWLPLLLFNVFWP
ncbi:QRFP-like peptide receptor [Liolophura sinensis]|uniref:QRFP-like peptide receptor n=1 Tax=Liolophura sinensis TaxID=3198878 RepID=UPI0031591969